jgi:putative transposase
MPNEFMHLTAMMNWHTGCVLSWKLSNTLDVDFCLEALGRGLVADLVSSHE